MASSNSDVPTPVPFPQPEPIQPPQKSPTTNPAANSPTTPQRRSRTSTNASTTSASSRIRAASIKLMETNPPPGMWAATGTHASKAPTLAEIRRGSFSSTGWNEEPQRYKAERRNSQTEEEGRRALRKTNSAQSGTTPDSPARPPVGKVNRTGSSAALAAMGTEPFPAVTEEEPSVRPSRDMTHEKEIFKTPAWDSKDRHELDGLMAKNSTEIVETPDKRTSRRHEQVRQYSNGYVPPPKVPWKTSMVIGLKGFWKWFLTIPGFLITLYSLNVVAWGGMLFLLLCNAAPAMCKPDCNDIQSPRRIWIEIDSQILNALFNVTGFGLAPWRFRDLYWWGWWRIGGAKRREIGQRRLAGIHRGWFRLPGSDHLPGDADVKTVSPEDPAVPIPHQMFPDPPPTGIHAPPTKGWKMDFVVWMNAWNTFFQVVLCYYMYHYNRYNRPSWATGTFVALGCIVAGLGGIMMFHEGKYVKKVEGVPVPKGYDERTSDVEAQHELAPAAATDGTAKI